MPSDATDQDRQSVQSQLEETPPDMDLVLPPGAEITVVGHGEDQVDVDGLMSHQFIDRIFIGLGIPKVALGLPQDANRATSRTQRRLLLEQKVKPYQRQIRDFARDLYRDVLDVEVTIDFDPVSARDAETVAQVSKILVEQGIKTPEEVEAEYWDWADNEEPNPPSSTADGPTTDDAEGEVS